MDREYLRKALRPAYRVVSGGLDAGRTYLDSVSTTGYQTGSTLLSGRSRPDGTIRRWEAIRGTLEEVSGCRTAVDIGCNEGYFSQRLLELGLAVAGLDVDARNVRVTRAGAPLGSVERLASLQMLLTPKTIELVPQGDCVLFLAVWHHLSRAYGLEAAVEMLEVVWARSTRVMFFETGEAEMPPDYNLPDLANDPADRLSALLAEHCSGGTVHVLGRFNAFDASGRPCMRHLFAVRRH